MGDWKGALRNIKKVLSGTVPDNGKKPDVASDQRKIAAQWSAPAPKIPVSREVSGLGKNRPSTRQSEIKSPTQTRPTATKAVTRETTALTRHVQPGAKSSQQKIAPPQPAPVGVPTSFGPSRKAALTRQDVFKKPDAWVLDGARLQFEPVSSGSPIDIVIGLDFGTSYTKAAVGLKDQIIPVSWEGVSQFPDPYLLPTEYSELVGGACHVGQAPTGEMIQVLQRLKHAFIDPSVSSDSIAQGAVFVALVLRYIRGWVFKVHGKKIGNSPIRWLLNIGSPSNGLETGRLEVAYRKLAGTAWLCSLATGDIHIADASSVVKSIKAEAIPDGLVDLAVLPEFVGQIAGYVKSAQRKAGLHALVDVGGGTLDVVTFIVHEQNGEDVFPFLVPEVRPLGTQMLDHNRFVGAPPEIQGVVDELEPVLEGAIFADRSGLPVDQVRQRDDVFWKAVEKVVHHVLLKTRNSRDPNSEHWKLGLPTFLTGGGAKVNGYVCATQTAGRRVAKGMDIKALPAHPSLADFRGDMNDYQRISVACGLAMDALNLGRIKPAKDVDDLVSVRNPTAPRLDHEELYG